MRPAWCYPKILVLCFIPTARRVLQAGAEPPAQWHYNPYWHSLEHVAPLPGARWAAALQQLPQARVLNTRGVRE